MADRKTAQPRRKERKEAGAAEAPKDKKEEAMQVEVGAADGAQPQGNGEVEDAAAAANGEAVEAPEPMELPPFEIITGYVPAPLQRSHSTRCLQEGWAKG